MKKELEIFINQRIVVDTRSSLIYIGTLEKVTDNCAVLIDADVHDDTDSSTSTARSLSHSHLPPRAAITHKVKGAVIKKPEALILGGVVAFRGHVPSYRPLKSQRLPLLICAPSSCFTHWILLPFSQHLPQFSVHPTTHCRRSLAGSRSRLHQS